MKYVLKNTLNRQVSVNLDGTDDPKTTIFLSPYAERSKEMTGVQANFVKTNYPKIVLRKVN